MALAAYYRDFYLKDKLFLTENSWDGWAEVADLRRADRAKEGLRKIDCEQRISLLPVGQGWAKSGSDIGFDITVPCSSDNPGLSLHECTVCVVRILAFHSHYLIQEQSEDLCLCFAAGKSSWYFVCVTAPWLMMLPTSTLILTVHGFWHWWKRPLLTPC